MMEILWYGHACFRLKDRNSTVITDPFNKSLGLSLPPPNADIVTISHRSPHHSYVEGVKGEFSVIDGPGEYEIGGTFITGIRMLPLKGEDPKDTILQNNVFVIYMDDIAICHLGDISHVPSQNQVEDMGNIDILLVPVGGQKALNATQASEVISLVEPYIVIPMHYDLPELTLVFDPVSKFLKEMGIAKADTVESLKLTKSNLPEETQIILLNPKGQTNPDNG